MGILKLLTGGLCGILWLYDIFTIMTKVREQNYMMLMNITVSGQSYGGQMY